MNRNRLTRALLTPLLPFAQWRDERWIRRRHVRIGDGSNARILLASDIHARDDWFPAGHVEASVRAIERAGPVDAVLLLGDFVGDDAAAIDWAAPILGTISSPTFAVLGNHDHWTDAHRVSEALASEGISMLTNRSSQLTDDLWLVGVDSCWGGSPDVAAAFDDVPVDARSIVLGHEPHLATMHNAFLHVAGHTHHAQIRSLVFGEMLARRTYVKYCQPYPRGLYDRGDNSWAYTTAGVGYSTVGLRVNCPPEVVVLDV